jgi:hypothetical protein
LGASLAELRSDDQEHVPQQMMKDVKNKNWSKVDIMPPNLLYIGGGGSLETYRHNQGQGTRLCKEIICSAKKLLAEKVGAVTFIKMTKMYGTTY